MTVVVAFRNDQYLWWQVAEYGFDSYMIRHADAVLNRSQPPFPDSFFQAAFTSCPDR